MEYKSHWTINENNDWIVMKFLIFHLFWCFQKTCDNLLDDVKTAKILNTKYPGKKDTFIIITKV